MNKHNEQGQRHGLWEWYYANGNLMSKANFLNGKRHGPWETYHPSGNLAAIIYHII